MACAEGRKTGTGTGEAGGALTGREKIVLALQARAKPEVGVGVDIEEAIVVEDW